MATKNRKPGRQPSDDDDTDDEDEDEDSKPMTRGETLRLVNSAVSAQLTRKLPAAIEAGVAPVIQQMTEIGDKITAGAQRDPKPGKGKGKRKRDDETEDDDDSGGEESPQVAALSKTVQSLTAKLKEQEQAAARAAMAQREATLTGSLRDSLGKAKVDPLRLKGALAVVRENLVRDKDGNIKYDDEGKAKWKAKRDGYDEELDIDAGIAEWAGTDEGKSYQAASGSPGGAGARTPAGGGRPATRPKDAAAAKSERVSAAKQGLLEAVQTTLAGGGSIAIDGQGDTSGQ